MNKPPATTEVTQSPGEAAPLVAAMMAGDEAAFSKLADRYRRDLQLYCSRRLGSFQDSEDLVQETFLRAWRWRKSFRGNSSFRTWLYRIATNACFDALQRRRRRPQLVEEPEAAQTRLEGIQAPDEEPDAAIASKEAIELAFMVAIQHLPPKERAVLILRGVLGLSAKDAASVLEASVASVNSALQRARRTLKDRLPERRLEWAQGSEASEEERALLQRYLEAIERADADAFVEMLCEEARFTMPPDGREREEAGIRDGER